MAPRIGTHGQSGRGALAAVAWLCAFGASAANPVALQLDDAPRARQVPVTVFEPSPAACASGCPVLLFGTGYRARPSDYSFLLAGLAEAGFLVVGIQHDLAHDPPLPNTGNVVRDRTPTWDRGVATVQFVKGELSRRYPAHDWSAVVLAGHSQGGDIAARLVSQQRFPVRALVTLDNRRVPLPADEGLRVLSLRSADQPADPGVLPGEATPGRAAPCIVRLATTRHDDMNDGAEPPARARMLDIVRSFLLNGHCAKAA